MGWTEQIANLVVISSQTGAYTGLFIYDPAPGTGNLLASAAAPSIGADPYGNDVVGGGFAVYDVGGCASPQLIFVGPKAISIRTGQPAEATFARVGSEATLPGGRLGLQIVGASTTGLSDTVEIDLFSNLSSGADQANGQIVYNNPAGGTDVYATWDAAGFVIAAGSITAVTPGTGTTSTPATAETWHSLGSPSATGFTSNVGQYRLTAEGETEIDVNLTANVGGGTAGTYSYATTLPAAYRPPTTRIYPLGFNQTLASGVSCALIVKSTGEVDVKLAALSAGTIAGTTARVPLNV